MSSAARVRAPKAPRRLLCAALAVAAFALSAAPASAGQFKSLLCAGNNGSNGFGTNTNTASPQNPQGIFGFFNFCGPAPDPAGEHAFISIAETQAGGNAGNGAFGNIYWDTPPFEHFRTAGGYTREPLAFNEGWRARFWGLNFTSGVGVQFLTQGTNVPNEGTQRPRSTIFGPHVWPFNTQLGFHRFIFELLCVRPAGCDRANHNSVDANTFQFTIEDEQPSQVALTNTDAPFLGGEWVRGAQTVTWNASDLGSGLRFEQVLVDNATKFLLDHRASCDIDSTGASGEFARRFVPCPSGGPFARSWQLETASLADGPHPLSVCTQDYGQARGLNETGGQSCTTATIKVDNNAPAAPLGLAVSSSNPARYLDHFNLHWSLPPDPGSPIAKVHYEIINAKGEVVVPEKAAAGSALTTLSNVQGPQRAGEYRLRLWLEDSVGFAGPASTVSIPHDTTPPAAPQEISVAPPSASRASNGFDLRWRNIVDAGSPIDAAHYQVLDANGQTVVPAQTITGGGLQAIGDLQAPSGRGDYSLRLWLSDAEGNVGAPASVPLAYECQRSEVRTGTSLELGLGKKESGTQIVPQGKGSLLKGRLSGTDAAGVGGASLCVFSRVVTQKGRDFLGLAVSGSDGRLQFAVPPGASRELSVDYRSGHRELVRQATLETVVRPSFKVRRKLVYNKHAAFFTVAVPGPDNDGVTVVLQVKRGKGWQAYRRCRTRNNGKCSVFYRFIRTFEPTKYRTRAQVRKTVGFPYRQGNSRALWLTVLPEPPGR